MSILTDKCTIKICYRDKSNGKNYRIAVKNVQIVVVGMIKQSVLKQFKKGGGGGGGGVGKGKFLYWRGEIIIIVIIVLSYLSYVKFSNLIYLTLPNLNI